MGEKRRRLHQMTHTGLAREGNVSQFVGAEPACGVSRQSIKENIKWWLGNQHMAFWHGLASIQRQAGELISGHSPAAKPRLPYFCRMQSTVVTGLLTGHSTPRRHLYTSSSS
jgi:hypothetical protein